MATRCITRNCSQLSTSASSSAPRAFLQLSPRRYLHRTPLPVLDFLLPGIPLSILRNGCTSMPTSRTIQVAKRSFTSSSRRQQTTAIFNPRQDEDGNNMNVEITPRASNVSLSSFSVSVFQWLTLRYQRLKEIMSKDSNPNLALRIQVESGGCHGFQYLMSLTTLPPVESFSSNSMPEEAKVVNLDEDDTVFTADDGSGAKVVMDGPSLELLKGSKVDFTMELIGSQFKIVDNPLATSSCGCGTSFDIKT